MGERTLRIPALRLIPRRARMAVTGRRPVGLVIGLVLLASLDFLPCRRPCSICRHRIKWT